MSDQRRFVWKSGRLPSTPIGDFWGISTTVRDPQIPNLPLETPSGGAVAYTLTCDVGAYVYTGNAATLTVGRGLALAAGAYVYTGNAATLTVGRNLALDAGAYAYVGNDATLDYVPGSPPAIDYVLDLATGAYVYVGSDADLVVGRSLPLAPGSYDYLGNDATLTYTPGIVVRPSMGWIPLREADEDKPGYKPRYTLEKEDKEARIKFIRDLMEGKTTAPVLEKSVRKVKAKVKDVAKLEQVYIAEALLMQVQEDATKRVEEAYQKWLRRPITDEEILLLGAFP